MSTIPESNGVGRTSLADPKDMYSTWMVITPEQASRWLESSNVHNRNLSMRYCENLARDMKEGNWRKTHQGVAFSRRGVLLDGQHRLMAIVLADVGIEMLVWFNCDPESLTSIDGGRPRTLADRLTLAGRVGKITHTEMGTLNAMLAGYGSPRKLTADEAEDAMRRHWKAIEFASTHLVHRIRGINTAVTRAVVARAYYSADHDHLAHFCHVLTNGIGESSKDAPIVLLWKYLVQQSRGGGRKEQVERYAKIERALHAYLNNERLTKLYAATSELFPLPEEV